MCLFHSKFSSIQRRYPSGISTSVLSLYLPNVITMSGSGSSDTTYNPDIFSARRIKVAPVVCLLGFISMIYAVVYRPKGDNTIQETEKEGEA